MVLQCDLMVSYKSSLTVLFRMSVTVRLNARAAAPPALDIKRRVMHYSLREYWTVSVLTALHIRWYNNVFSLISLKTNMFCYFITQGTLRASLLWFITMYLRRSWLKWLVRRWPICCQTKVLNIVRMPAFSVNWRKRWVTWASVALVYLTPH